MTLRRGFKTEASGIAREVRSELELQPADPLDPRDLARHLDIEIIPLSALSPTAGAAVRYLMRVEESVFSAVTVFRGTHRTIVHNDAHAPGRIVSNLAHELAHGLLFHAPTPAIDAHGCRDWDPTVEEEADWLGATLLVPEEATLQIVRQRLPVNAAANRFGVTPTMMEYRLRITGARVRVSRAAGYRR